MATRAEWIKRVRRFERSGLDPAEFAQREGIKAKQLGWWRWKLRSSDEPATQTEPEFLPVRIVTSPPPPMATPTEIALPNGRLVRVRPGFDPATLERVLAIAAEQEVAC
jgi:transposase